ncbi:sulfatase [Hyphomonas sp. WL0036]|uniref:sulfatase n=1 Tax=Hyphomonas sediminis TaxID=2866160 RepID=UPI001C7EFF6E|nr:sulfatase [Hyphomonas sediminis]MBY9067517.1 sulfatase [Hyphomonas sediminis]
MFRKILLGLVAAILILGALAFFNRKEIILYMVTHTGRVDVAPNRPVEWMQGPAAAALAPSERPPNIIFILADDLGMNDISTLGGGMAGGRVKTPNIDRLAAQGALFSTAYSGTGTCAPSRAMLMTGRYPTRTGFEYTPTPPGMSRIVPMFANEMRTGLPPTEQVKENEKLMPPFAEQGLPGEEVTIAEVLKERGYHTVHIGKWHLGNEAPFRPNDQGFDESLDMASALYLPAGDPRGVEARLDFDPIDKFLWARMQFAASYNDSDWFEPGGYLTDYWTDEALKVIDANKNQPFFLYLAHWGIHTPLQATKEDYEAVGDIEPHRARVYAAMMRAVDRSVGRVMDKLEEEGLADNTIIVFSSDNGGAGYIGIPEVNQPYRGWKITLFEGGIRVPLFVKWPAVIQPGTVVDEPVAHIDVMPTLAAAAGAALPAGVEIDGQNLLPLATGTGTVERKDDAIFWSSGYYKVVRAGGWKLQVNGRQQKSWLFDLNTDPTEQVNLADSQPEKLAELQALIDAHWKDARAPLYPYTIESPIKIDHTQADAYVEGEEYVYWPN